MKILCFSDLHRDREAAAQLVERSEDVDIVVGAGDFANMHTGILDTIEVLSAIEKPSVLVPGNGETVEELRDATSDWKSATVLHGSGCEIEGVPFWGVGGGIPVTPFGDWSYDFNEAEAEEMLAGCRESGVLIVHSPPFETVDRDRTRRVRGSRSIRQAVLDKVPLLVVCGHIHDDWEKRVQLGPSLVLNAGPRGVVVELEV